MKLDFSQAPRSTPVCKLSAGGKPSRPRVWVRQRGSGDAVTPPRTCLLLPPPTFHQLTVETQHQSYRLLRAIAYTYNVYSPCRCRPSHVIIMATNITTVETRLLASVIWIIRTTNRIRIDRMQIASLGKWWSNRKINLYKNALYVGFSKSINWATIMFVCEKAYLQLNKLTGDTYLLHKHRTRIFHTFDCIKRMPNDNN